jgi:PhzF family phenazine biosynthesis protein
MQRIKIKQVDAFTTTPFMGNPAGVVTQARGLTEKEMQFIAREMNLSETAYILPPSVDDADLRIRWFTPSAEVPLCGHATIASFHALAEEGLHGIKKTGETKFRLETKVGVLPITVSVWRKRARVTFGLPVPKFKPIAIEKNDIARMLNTSPNELHAALPIVKDTNNYLYIPFKRLNGLLSLKPDFGAVLSSCRRKKILGVCVLTTDTVDSASSVHSRFFAPAVGINEDPVTGSANGPLGAYLFEQGLVMATEGVVSIIGEQGDVLGRKGRVGIELSVDGKSISSVSISGEAVTVLEGHVLLE